MKYQRITIEVPALTDEAAAYLHKFIDALMHAVDDQYYRQIHHYYAQKLSGMLKDDQVTEEELVEHWKTQGKNPATIKNYMSKLRKTALLLDNPKLIKPDNSAYTIENRSYAPLYNKAIHHIDLSTCTDDHIRLSLEGQALFGLRREESMKFTLSEAFQGNTLNIMPSWTKGGIGRVLTITNPAQREWLNKIALLVKPGESLIPSDRTYKQHLSHYQVQAARMGVCKLHGLRHAYAQRRYRELTTEFDRYKRGLISPIEGGKHFKAMTAYEKSFDRKARQIISRELGHSRINIVKIYCG